MLICWSVILVECLNIHLLIYYGRPGKAEVTVGSAERGRDKKVEKREGLPVPNKKYLSFDDYLRIRREKKAKREAREKSRYGMRDYRSISDFFGRIKTLTVEKVVFVKKAKSCALFS